MHSIGFMIFLISVATFSHTQDVSNNKCNNLPGKKFMSQNFNIPVNDLNKLLFTDCEWYRNFQKELGNSNLNITDWKNDMRVVSYTTFLGQNMIGPNTAQIIEIQKNRSQNSSENVLYNVDTATVTRGVPFGDSFFYLQHTCLHKVNESASSLTATGELRFKRPLIVREFIENAVNDGLVSYFKELEKKLNAYKPE